MHRHATWTSFQIIVTEPNTNMVRLIEMHVHIYLLNPRIEIHPIKTALRRHLLQSYQSLSSPIIIITNKYIYKSSSLSPLYVHHHHHQQIYINHRHYHHCMYIIITNCMYVKTWVSIIIIIISSVLMSVIGVWFLPFWKAWHQWLGRIYMTSKEILWKEHWHHHLQTCQLQSVYML